MKVLLLTGKLAEKIVRKYSKRTDIETEIIVLNIPVAALLTLEQIRNSLEKIDTKKFDLILIPGLIRGDTATIFGSKETPIYKGPKYAADLPTILDSIEKSKLSTIIPACELLKNELQQKALKELERVEKEQNILLKKPGNMLIGQLAIGRDFPIRIMAEIVDAALMSTKEIQRLAKHYIKNGAHIIDVGMVAGGSRPADAKRAVEAIKKISNIIVSIDSLDPEEIREAVNAGADLILSADAGNIDKIAPFAKEIPIVCIPTNQSKGYIPSNITGRIKFLEEIIEKAKKLGIKKIIGDLILEPSNLIESLIAFYYFGLKHPNIPLFIGVSNVTELFDADSIGINALLAYLSSEIKASIILATEKSIKAKGTIEEQSLASKMVFLAKKRNSVPKDLGIDLLVLKDKRKIEEPYNKKLETQARTININERTKPSKIDPHGEFRIILDRRAKKIVAIHYSSVKLIPINILKAKTAERLYKKIIEMNLISKLDHAAYLGSELRKAEISLKTGKNYIQDDPLFK